MPAPTRSAPERSYLTLLSMMVLIGIEVFGVALSGGWALAGLLDLGEIVGFVLMGVFSVLGLWIMVQLWRRATSLEIGR